MTEREKIINIITEANEKCPTDKNGVREWREYIADALLAAGIGDIESRKSDVSFSAVFNQELVDALRKEEQANEYLVKKLDERCDTCPEFEQLKQENKMLRLMMFAFVRNSAVLPFGLRLGKSEQEITDKTFETIAEAKKMLDVEKMKALMNLATDKEKRYDRE